MWREAVKEVIGYFLSIDLVQTGSALTRVPSLATSEAAANNKVFGVISQSVREKAYRQEEPLRS